MRDLTKKNITLYDNYLHDKGLAQTYVHRCHKKLQIYINEALALGYLKENPYEGIRINRGKSVKRRYLTKEEVNAIESIVPTSKVVERARDAFLFQCYTSLSYSDMKNTDFRKDIEERGGRMVIANRRKKTGEDFFVVLLKPAVRILEKYDYKLPVPSNWKYNVRLKEVAAAAKIGKSITSHMGRHSISLFLLKYKQLKLLLF